jgi:hypothetical protein
MSPGKPLFHIAQPRNTSASSARDATKLLQLRAEHRVYEIGRETKRIFVNWYLHVGKAAKTLVLFNGKVRFRRRHVKS